MANMSSRTDETYQDTVLLAVVPIPVWQCRRVVCIAIVFILLPDNKRAVETYHLSLALRLVGRYLSSRKEHIFSTLDCSVSSVVTYIRIELIAGAIKA